MMAVRAAAPGRTHRPRLRCYREAKQDASGARDAAGDVRAGPQYDDERGEGEQKAGRLGLAVHAADQDGQRVAGVLEPAQRRPLTDSTGECADQHDNPDVEQDRREPGDDQPGHVQVQGRPGCSGEHQSISGQGTPAVLPGIQDRVTVVQDIQTRRLEVIHEIVRLSAAGTVDRARNCGHADQSGQRPHRTIVAVSNGWGDAQARWPVTTRARPRARPGPPTAIRQAAEPGPAAAEPDGVEHEQNDERARRQARLYRRYKPAAPAAAARMVLGVMNAAPWSVTRLTKLSPRYR